MKPDTPGSDLSKWSPVSSKISPPRAERSPNFHLRDGAVGNLTNWGTDDDQPNGSLRSIALVI